MNRVWDYEVDAGGELIACPTPGHGKHRVIGQGTTKGPDPYSIEKLACGCEVACFGPGEPYVALKKGRG